MSNDITVEIVLAEVRALEVLVISLADCVDQETLRAAWPANREHWVASSLYNATASDEFLARIQEKLNFYEMALGLKEK